MMKRASLSQTPDTEQIMGMPAQVERWTSDRVRALIDESRTWPRYELIDGDLLVTPAPRPAHQAAAFALARLLAEYVERTHIAADVFLSPADLELRSNTIVQPDVFVVPLTNIGPRLDDWTSVQSLLLAIEILSPASAHSDRTTKRRFYLQAADVAEYWVVDLDARVIERWRRGEERPALLDDTIVWQPIGSSEALVIDLSALFARVFRQS